MQWGLCALCEAKLCQMRDSNPRSLMRNKSWACRLRPLGQSDLDMDYNNVAVMENVRLAERSKAVSLSLTLIEIEGSNPSPDKKLHFLQVYYFSIPFFLKHSSAISQDEIIKNYSPPSYNRRQEARTMWELGCRALTRQIYYKDDSLWEITTQGYAFFHL